MLLIVAIWNDNRTVCELRLDLAPVRIPVVIAYKKLRYLGMSNIT